MARCMKQSLLQCHDNITKTLAELENIVVAYDPDDPIPGLRRLDFCSSNTHLLLHLVEGVLQQGLPYVYSQWALESKLGKLRNFVFRRVKPEDNMVRNIKTYTQAMYIQNLGNQFKSI